MPPPASLDVDHHYPASINKVTQMALPIHCRDARVTAVTGSMSRDVLI